jgi:hypothetical protein
MAIDTSCLRITLKLSSPFDSVDAPASGGVVLSQFKRYASADVLEILARSTGSANPPCSNARPIRQPFTQTSPLLSADLLSVEVQVLNAMALREEQL